MHAALGPLHFSLSNTATARIPRLEPVASVAAGGETLLSIEQDGRLFLVIDHRTNEAAPARVEMWLPETAGECEIEALFVLCDALRPHSPVQQPSGLAALATMLQLSLQ